MSALSEKVQRRLSAILVADVVGYSRLMGVDEAGTLERLQQARRSQIEPLLAEYGGRIIKLMGDGAIVEFASVVEAVRCALLVSAMAQRRGARTRPVASPFGSPFISATSWWMVTTCTATASMSPPAWRRWPHRGGVVSETVREMSATSSTSPSRNSGRRR